MAKGSDIKVTMDWRFCATKVQACYNLSCVFNGTEKGEYDCRLKEIELGPEGCRGYQERAFE